MEDEARGDYAPEMQEWKRQRPWANRGLCFWKKEENIVKPFAFCGEEWR